jgi:hypothetical protein
MYQKNSTSTTTMKIREHMTHPELCHCIQHKLYTMRKTKHWDRKQYERMLGRNATVVHV